MTKPFSEWTVLPHGKLTRLEDNLLSVTGVLHMPPMGDVERRMTVVRLGDGRLIVYSAIALDESEMRAIEAFGTPTYLIVPSDIHRMDAKTWKDRYPALRVITPPSSREKVEQLVHVDDTFVNFADPSVHFVVLPGTADREAALIVETSRGTTLVLNDVIFNLANRPGLSGWLFKAIGMTGDAPHVPPVIKLRLIENQAALRAQLDLWARLPRLQRMILSHGNIVENDAAGVLARVAADLAA